tara:strand:+ start:5555 stop:5947 length:393 start_codon:yes stop_codon:yes gene_type:complete
MGATVELSALPAFSALVKEHIGGDTWRLTERLSYSHRSGRAIVIPEGFVCDGDSVPRIPFIYALYKGRAIQAAWVHDYLYREQRGKDFADLMFLDAMEDQGLPARIRYPIYWGPALFGDRSYSKYKSKGN